MQLHSILTAFFVIVFERKIANNSFLLLINSGLCVTYCIDYKKIPKKVLKGLLEKLCIETQSFQQADYKSVYMRVAFTHNKL